MQFSNFQRGLVSMLVPVALGILAATVIVERPFEKKAEAVVSPPETSSVKSPILAPGTSEQFQAELVRLDPIVIVGQAPTSKRFSTHVTRPLDRECWQGTPGAECNVRDLTQGTGTVLVCTCK